MNWNRRNFLLLTSASALASGLMTVGFTGTAMAQEGQPGGVLKVSVTIRPYTMNPLKGIGTTDYVIFEMLYEGLTKIGEDLTPQPRLAESWEANADHTEFTFRLREGLVFKDGSPLTAADVVATFEAILDEATASPARFVIGPIQSITAVDDLTVLFTLSKAYVDLPTAVAHNNARIVPAAILADDPARLDTEDHGCGPFKLVSYDPSQMVRVERNPTYFMPGRPYVDGIDLIIYPDAVAEVGGLINGETHIMLAANPPEFRRLEGQANVELVRRPTGAFLNLVLRADTEPFDDVRVRQALSFAIDRQMLVDLVLDGFGRPAHDSFISPEYAYFSQVPEKTYDVERAKALLAEAGHPDGLSITLYAAAAPPLRTDLAVAIQQLAQPAGFNIEVQTVPMDTYVANILRKANFYVGNWTAQATQDLQYNKLMTTNSAQGDSFWNNAAFDEQVYLAQTKGDPAERAAIYKTTQEQMADEVPFLVPFFRDQLSAHRTGVNGYFIHPLIQPHYFEEVWLDQAAG